MSQLLFAPFYRNVTHLTVRLTCDVLHRTSGRKQLERAVAIAALYSYENNMQKEENN